MVPPADQVGGSPQLLAEEAALLVQAVVHGEPVRLAPGDGIPEWVAWNGEDVGEGDSQRARGTARALRALVTWLNTREAKLPSAPPPPPARDAAAVESIEGECADARQAEPPNEMGAQQAGSAPTATASHSVTSSIDIACSVMASAVGSHLVDTASSPSEAAPILDVLVNVESADGRRVGACAVRWLCEEILNSRPPLNADDQHPPLAKPTADAPTATTTPPQPQPAGAAPSSSAKGAPPAGGRVARVGRGMWRETVDWMRQWAQQWPELLPLDGDVELVYAYASDGDDDSALADDVVARVAQWMDFACHTALPPDAAGAVLSNSVDWGVVSVSAHASAVVELYRDCGPASARAALYEVYAIGCMPRAVAHGSVLCPWLKQVCGSTSFLAARRIELSHAATGANNAASDTTTTTTRIGGDGTVGDVAPSVKTESAEAVADPLPGLDRRALDEWTAELAAMSREGRAQVVTDVSRLTDFVPRRFASRLAVAWTVAATYYASRARADEPAGDEVDSFVTRWEEAIAGDGDAAQFIRYAARTSGLCADGAWGMHVGLHLC
jgi:hypothetical protein